MEYNSELDFTINSEDGFYDTVDMEQFKYEDADVIYQHLRTRMKLIPFCDYLKRYIFRIAGFEGDFRSVDIKEYQQIIIESFSENNTPKSFSETSSKLSTLSRNWLTQASVNRQIVFLLGFGLNMSVDDVSRFLVNALRERDFNFKNPFEVICWYCFKNGYKYPKFQQLRDAYSELSVSNSYDDFDRTIGIRDLFFRIENEEELMLKLAELKTENNGHFFSVTAKRNFDSLYKRTRQIIAEKYNEDEQAEAEAQAAVYLEKMSSSQNISFEEKIERAASIRKSARVFSEDDITESDVEKFLCCGIPFDNNGNLFKFSKSTLENHFNNKRMSRQHINDLIKRKKDVDRFDLITLSFFVCAMETENENNKKRYISFVDSTNEILEECYMGEIYVTNPYECFLLMCILSDCPMGVYSDILEKSFEDDM